MIFLMILFLKILKIQSQAESSHVHTIAKQHSLVSFVYFDLNKKLMKKY